jgi:UPF0716 protein FxsA
MSLVKWALVGVLVLPAAELATFVAATLLIGWLWTVVLFLATSLVGVLVLRRTGRANLSRFGAALRQDGLRAVHLESPGFAAMAGGILLVLPGFITDLLGALLFVAPLRRWAGAAIAQVLRERQRAPPDRRVVELKPHEWRQVSEKTIEHTASPRRRRKLIKKDSAAGS